MKYRLDKIKSVDEMLQYIHSVGYKFGNQFIIDNADLFDDRCWLYISSYYELEEGLIERFSGKVNWDRIISNQRISSSFISKNKDKINFHYISPHNVVNFEYVIEHIDKFNFHYLISHTKWPKYFIKNLYERFKSNMTNMTVEGIVLIPGKKESEISFLLKMLENSSVKLNHGSQLELPFSYPHYRTDVELKERYIENIEFNIKQLTGWIETN